MPGKSLFLKELDQKFPISLLTIEYYGENMVEGLTDEGIAQVLTNTLKHTCGLDNPLERDYAHLQNKLQEAHDSFPTESPETSPTKKTFRSSYTAWLRATNTIEMLGKMTNYNLGSMRDLYCKTDFQVTLDLIANFTKGLWEDHLVAYEAFMYAQGGHYAGDGGGQTIDANSPAAIDALARMGFGTVSAGALKDAGFITE